MCGAEAGQQDGSLVLGGKWAEPQGGAPSGAHGLVIEQPGNGTQCEISGGVCVGDVGPNYAGLRARGGGECVFQIFNFFKAKIRFRNKQWASHTIAAHETLRENFMPAHPGCSSELKGPRGPQPRTVKPGGARPSAASKTQLGSPGKEPRGCLQARAQLASSSLQKAAHALRGFWIRPSQDREAGRKVRGEGTFPK